MPRTTRERLLGAAQDDVWKVVGDPYHLARWWPRVQRVEDVRGERFTEVLRAKSGRPVRADFRVVESRRPVLRRWSQQVEGTPFERVLAGSEVTVELSRAQRGRGARDAAGTRVAITLDQRMRGMSRFGGLLVRRASRRLLDEALEGLEGAVA